MAISPTQIIRGWVRACTYVLIHVFRARMNNGVAGGDQWSAYGHSEGVAKVQLSTRARCHCSRNQSSGWCLIRKNENHHHELWLCRTLVPVSPFYNLLLLEQRVKICSPNRAHRMLMKSCVDLYEYFRRLTGIGTNSRKQTLASTHRSSHLLFGRWISLALGRQKRVHSMRVRVASRNLWPDELPNSDQKAFGWGQRNSCYVCDVNGGNGTRSSNNNVRNISMGFGIWWLCLFYSFYAVIHFGSAHFPSVRFNFCRPYRCHNNFIWTQMVRSITLCLRQSDYCWVFRYCPVCL